jgi:hypothetical protein
VAELRRARGLIYTSVVIDLDLIDPERAAARARAG